MVYPFFSIHIFKAHKYGSTDACWPALKRSRVGIASVGWQGGSVIDIPPVQPGQAPSLYSTGCSYENYSACHWLPSCDIQQIQCQLPYFLQGRSTALIRVVLYFHRLNLALLGMLPRSTDGPLCWRLRDIKFFRKGSSPKGNEMRYSFGQELLGMVWHDQKLVM